MNKFIKTFATIYFSIFILANIYSQDLQLMDDFSAYYTKITSGAEWEIFDRTGNYPDIIVNLGALNGKFIFWRGASYLPYWVNDSEKNFMWKRSFKEMEMDQILCLIEIILTHMSR